MTAIAGLWQFDGKPDAAGQCAAMLSSQAIYGPHGTAQWDDGSIALGRRLFRLLPEDTYDKGPAISSDGRLAVVADIRLDNRDELIVLLEIAPARAATLCDTDILLAAFERWDEACLDRLVGDFAFAVWDRVGRRLVLARDFAGQRPLYYHRSGKFLAFASMVKGLHALGEIPRAADEAQVADFLVGLPEHGPSTFFRSIARVEPGHAVTVTPSGIATRRYWNPARTTLKLANAQAYAEALRHHLDTATRARLRRVSGPIGTHLSGGLDSSAVASSAARLLAPGELVAFTSVPRQGYDGPDPHGRFGDEGPLAAMTAVLHPNIRHVLVRPGARTPLDGLDRNFFIFERPVLNLCNQVWGNAINDAARDEGIAVLLTGQMGNMTISFDPRSTLAEFLIRGQPLHWLREIRTLMRHRQIRWRGALLNSFGPWLPAPVWRGIHRLSGRSMPAVTKYSAINPERLAALDMAGRARAAGGDLSFRPFKDSFTLRTWMFRHVDFANMNKGVLGGWGIDVRDPTADRRLVEFCLSIPLEQYISDGMPRGLAMRALAGRVPAEVLNVRGKGLQGIDWHEGATAARPQIGEEIERLADYAPAAQALDIARLRELVKEWPSGGWERDEVSVPYRAALLRGISAGHFLRKAGGGNM